METLQRKDGVKSEIHDDEVVFELAYLMGRFPIVYEIGNCSLFVKEDGIHVGYALMERTYEDSSGIFYEHVFSGYGISSSLREMRHTYFGSDFDGYCFYLPGKAVGKAFEILSQYFDIE